jgi:murein DD-endopeptidase MepM/ murein hydrolase activator NlpD
LKNIDTAAFGVVSEIGIGNEIYGNYVIMNHGSGFRTMYAHLSKIAWGAGTVLHHNTKLGEVGNTGQSTAPHLHYEVHINGTPVNPSGYIR